MSLYSIYWIMEPFSCPLLIISKVAQVIQYCLVGRRQRWAGLWRRGILKSWSFIDQPAHVAIWLVIHRISLSTGNGGSTLRISVIMVNKMKYKSETKSNLHNKNRHKLLNKIKQLANSSKHFLTHSLTVLLFSFMSETLYD